MYEYNYIYNKLRTYIQCKIGSKKVFFILFLEKSKSLKNTLKKLNVFFQ